MFFRAPLSLQYEYDRKNKGIVMWKVLVFFILLSSIIEIHAEKSYSLFDGQGVPLDEKLVALMNFKEGIFIEVGAHDGLSQSNTKRFEEFYGWTGILVEPSPILYEQLCCNRPYSKCFQCALGTFEEDGQYVYGDFNGCLMSSVNGNRLHKQANTKVPIRSLQSVLDEVGLHHINFFSLDTEGYELNILKGIDFTRTTFDYLLIEIYSHQYHDILLFLAEKGYRLIESFSNYHRGTHPGWCGTHNDYLFKRNDF